MLALRYRKGYYPLRVRLLALFWLPIALVLWPLVRWNYWLRELGELPDEWYWADLWLLNHGYWVKV